MNLVLLGLITVLAVCQSKYIDTGLSTGVSSVSEDCLCQNGGICLQDGYCACWAPYVGPYCERDSTKTASRKKRAAESGKCPFPSDPEHGKVLFEPETLVSGAAIKYKCAEGYSMMGSSTRHCQDSGTYTGERPTCELLCSFPTLTQRDGLTYVENPRQIGEPLRDAAGNIVLQEIVFNCSDGYSMTGTPKLRCLSGGKWDSDPPTCGKVGDIACPGFGEVKNGHSEPKSSSTHAVGTVVNFGCEADHRMIGTAVIVCTSSGSWSTQPPQCVAKTASAGQGRCSKPKPIKYGRYLSYAKPEREESRSDADSSGDTYPHDTTAFFECNENYKLEVDYSQRRCLTSGEWSGSDPVCKPVCGRGIEPKIPHIIGGAVAERHAFPWQAALTYHKSDMVMLRMILCGAVLLAEKWAVTAAHCVHDEGTKNRKPIGDFLIFFGKHFYNRNLDPNDVDSSMILQFIVHPDYDPLSIDNDIVLLLLEKTIKFSYKILPVCLPSASSKLEPGTKGIVSGWGYTDKNDTTPKELMMTVLPIVDKKKCEENYRTLDFQIQVTDSMFCAGFDQGGTSTCRGDSGGPYVFKEGDHFTLEGLVSWGNINDCAGSGYYAGFVRVSKFVDWIRRYIVSAH